jgi:hypothetical protein
VVQHGDDIGSAILLEADVRNLALREKFLRPLRNGALGMLTDRGRPVAGLLTHVESPVRLAWRKSV